MDIEEVVSCKGWKSKDLKEFDQGVGKGICSPQAELNAVSLLLEL